MATNPTNIDRLRALLQLDPSGEEIAALLARALVDDDRRDLLVARLAELERDQQTTGKREGPSRQEYWVLKAILDGGEPLTASGVAGLMPDAAKQEYKSLAHRNHVSTLLNAVVAKGLLGRITFGNEVFFANTEEAVMEQLKRRNEKPSECSPGGIADQTGMPLSKVIEVLTDLA